MKINNFSIGIIALVFGILVLAVPSLLRWIVGIALIVIGVLLITGKKKL